MAAPPDRSADVATIMAERRSNGADYWATPDGRLAKGGPFSTLGAARLLAELGEDPAGPVLAATADLIWRAWRPDGRFRLAPSGAIYPCQTANAAATLAHLGQADDPRLQRTFEHLLVGRHTDCGWRCLKFSYGRGPETECSNPGPTLLALDAFRFTRWADSTELDGAVDFLLSHWDSRVPLGPCHYGIGTLFLQVSYPLGDYHLFSWVQVLSHYDRARRDPRFADALATLEARLADGEVVIERTSRAFTGLHFCRKGAPSALATQRFRELASRLS